MRSDRAALARPIRGRRSNTSVWPSRSPRISTEPSDGNSSDAATWSSVVFPAPFGPITTQRSSSLTLQSMPRSRAAPSLRTATS